MFLCRFNNFISAHHQRPVLTFQPERRLIFVMFAHPLAGLAGGDDRQCMIQIAQVDQLPGGSAEGCLEG